MEECESLRKLGVGKRLPDDPLFAAGDNRCRFYVREGIVDIDNEELCHQVVAEFPCEVPHCREVLSSLLQFEMHYNTCHRFVCCQCKKPLPSAHLLDLHISESHDIFFSLQADRKPMFKCFVEECPVMSSDQEERRSHCIEVHSFPPDFRYDQSRKKNKKNVPQHKVQSNSEKMAVDGVQGEKPLKSKKNKKNVPQHNVESNGENMAVDGVQEEKPQGSKKNNENTPQFNKVQSNSGIVAFDGVQGGKPQRSKQFTFGHSKRGKAFSSNPVYHNEKKSPDTCPSEISTSEVMDTLP